MSNLIIVSVSQDYTVYLNKLYRCRTLVFVLSNYLVNKGISSENKGQKLVRCFNSTNDKQSSYFS